MTDKPIAYRVLGDGRAIWLYKRLFNYVICIGKIDDKAYEDFWEYTDSLIALHSMAEWDPSVKAEPQGWVRHPPSGRRRFPDGDPESEEVRL